MDILVTFMLALIPSAVYGVKSYKMTVPDGELPWDFSLNLYHHQSPIDIPTTSNSLVEIKVEPSNPLTLKLHCDTNSTYVLRNSGHGVEVVLDSQEQSGKNKKQPKIYGGILQNKYVFKNLHYHWGEKNDVGSEHFMGGKSYSMEAHMVCYKASYNDFETALTNKDGVVVFTFFLQVGEENQELKTFLPHIETVKMYNTNNKAIVDPTAAFWFLSKIDQINQDYYAYTGSLTTPQYDEVVTFFIVPNPINISAQQIDKFRQIQDSHNHILKSNRRKEKFERVGPIAHVTDNFRVKYVRDINVQ